MVGNSLRKVNFKDEMGKNGKMVAQSKRAIVKRKEMEEVFHTEI